MEKKPKNSNPVRSNVYTVITKDPNIGFVNVRSTPVVTDNIVGVIHKGKQVLGDPVPGHADFIKISWNHAWRYIKAENLRRIDRHE